MGRLVVEATRRTGAAVRVFDLPSADFTPFASDPGVEVATGNIASPSDVAASVEGASAIVHLAAILPPLSEENPELTERVNVEGTAVLVDAARRLTPDARFVFSSSVSVYGRPGGTEEGAHKGRPYDSGSVCEKVVGVDDPVAPDDVYALSKAESEKVVLDSGLDWISLRISGVSVPVFQEPPAAWPFLPSQKIEFVHRDDAVTAIVSATAESAEGRKIHLVSGGPAWRMTGAQYVEDFYRIVEVDPHEAVYQPEPGHFTWYDSAGSQRALRYQNTSYEKYLEQVRADVERMLTG